MGLFDALVFKVGADTSPFQREMRAVEKTSKRVSASIGVAFKAVGAIGASAASAMVAVGAAAIQTGSEFEGLQARLSTLLGSASAGKRRMDELFQVATSTPFNLSELVEAEAIMESFGVNAEEMRGAVMDLSGALGLSLTDSAAAVGRAFAGGAGSADILRERGVLAMVELRTGIKATEMSAADFQTALVETLTDPDGKIAGGTARLAGTFKGTLSNLEDELTKFRKQIADSGLFEGVKFGAKELLAIMDENKETIGEVADAIGVGLLAALQMSIRGVGYLAEGFHASQLAASLVEESVYSAGAATARFFEAQIRDFEGMFSALERGAGALGLDDLVVTFNKATRGFNSAANAVAGEARSMEDGAAAASAEVDALTESVGAYIEESNRLVAAMNTRSGGTITDKRKQDEPPKPSPGGGGASAAVNNEEVADAARLIAAAEAEAQAAAAQTNRVYQDREYLMASLLQGSLDYNEREAIALQQRKDQLREYYREQIVAAEGNFNEQLALREQWMEDEAALVEDHDKRVGRAQVQAYSQTAGNIASAASDLYSLMGDENEKAARRMFNISKAAGIVQATIDGALAVTSAMADVPYPANIAVAAAAGAAAAAQIAVISAQKMPSFDDTPGVVQVSGSGGMVGFGGGDYVAAAKSPEDLRRQVDRTAGRDHGPEVIPVMPVFEGRTWEMGTRDQTRRPGPLRDAIRGTTVGAVGRSGF